MKRTISFIVIALLCANAFAQSAKFNYEEIMNDESYLISADEFWKDFDEYHEKFGIHFADGRMGVAAKEFVNIHKSDVEGAKLMNSLPYYIHAGYWQTLYKLLDDNIKAMVNESKIMKGWSKTEKCINGRYYKKGKDGKLAEELYKDYEEYKDIFENPEHNASFPGGDKALAEFIKDNLRTPSDAPEGRVVTSFIVNRDGSVSDAKVLRSLNDECDKEALRIIGLMPKWIPGSTWSVKTATRYTIPILFLAEKP